MEKRKRRVHFTHGWDNEKKEPIKRVGWFHEWGIDYDQHQDPVEPYHMTPVQFTVGVVEDDDGDVFLVHPSNIQFR